ncbi:MAG: response regulator [Nitrospirae bacterium]|nr:response regulator [Nitrospirota bacterium]
MEAAHEIKSGTPVEILFVDDEKNVLQALKRLCMDEDYEIILANSAEEALEVLRNHPNLGLIVSDQRMPGMTGSEFLARAKDIMPDTVRILLTGYADINAVADAINKGGAYRYITKPWKDEELLQIIGDAVKRYSLVQENKRLQEIIRKQNEELKRWNSQLEFFVQEQTIEIQNKNKALEKLNEDLIKNFKNSIHAFSSLIELRDRRTGNHSKNVAEISTKTALAMKLSSEEVETITVAALLHDIGKIGIPDVVLLMEFDQMSAEERNEYMQHPVRGQAAVDSVEDFRDAGILIRHHHECYNGMGFPDKLPGGRIPVGARIIAVADFIDKTVRNLDKDNAVEITLGKVRDDLGKMFDPQIYPFIEVPVREVLAGITRKSKANMIETELNVSNIQVGMLLARDVKSGTGLILLSKGTVLNPKNIQALKRYYQLDPSKTGIFVLVKR